jgi:hypothetical protein
MKQFLLLVTSIFLFTSCIGDKKKIEPEEVTPVIIEKSTETPQKKPILACTTAVFVTDPHYSSSPIKINTQEEELKYALENYFDQLKSLDADNIISMTYPKLFIPINKNLFREYINTMLNSQDLSIVDFQTSIQEINPVSCLSTLSFAQIAYTSDITINFVNPELYSDDVKMRFLADVMSQKYGSDNIRIDTELRTIRIKKKEKLLAIKEDGIWSFMMDNPEYRRLYPKILPKEILNYI